MTGEMLRDWERIWLGGLAERFPLPERSGEGVEQRAAEDDEGGAKEMAARKIHGLSVASLRLSVVRKVFETADEDFICWAPWGNLRGTIPVPSLTAMI